MDADPVSDVEIDVPGLNLEFWRQVSLEVYSSFKWIERKVETFSFDVELGTTRRHSSYDMWVPEPFKKLGWLPVTNFKKEDLRDLDVRDRSERALSTLTKTDNVRLGVALLFSGLAPANQNQANWDKILQIVKFDPDFQSQLDRDTLLSEYQSMIDPAYRDVYRFLSQLLIDAFILWVQFPEKLDSDYRLIVKISHEYDLPAPITKSGIIQRNKNLRRIDINTRMCGSYHLEVRAPLGQLVSQLRIISRKIDDGDYEYRKDTKTPTQVAHTTSPGSNSNPDQYAVFSILRRRGAFECLSLITTLFLSLFLLIALINFLVERYCRINLVKLDANSLGTTILLVGPAVIMLFLASQPEHQLVASLVKAGKRALYTSAAILFAAAALLSGIFSENHRIEKWIIWGIWAFCLIYSFWTSWVTVRWFYGSTTHERKNKGLSANSVRVSYKGER